MLSKDTEFRLDHAMTDQKVGDQISARLISVTPANAVAAQAVLDLLDRSAKMKASISERLVIGMAGDAAGAAGKEMAKKINGMVDVLAAQANGDGLAFATFSGQVAGMTTNIQLEADGGGAMGNNIILVFDGLLQIDEAIFNWNAANPSNQVNFISGIDTQVPNNGAVIQLSGGADDDLASAQAAMGSEHMSSDTFECLVHSLASRPAAIEFKAAYNAMIDAVQAIV